MVCGCVSKRSLNLIQQFYLIAVGLYERFMKGANEIVDSLNSDAFFNPLTGNLFLHPGVERIIAHTASFLPLPVLFRPLQTPIYHSLPVFHLIQRIGTLPPFGQATMIGHTLSFLDEGVFHPERLGRVYTA
jgi:hypothetical protein